MSYLHQALAVRVDSLTKWGVGALGGNEQAAPLFQSLHGGDLRFEKCLDLLGNHLRRLDLCLCSARGKLAEPH